MSIPKFQALPESVQILFCVFDPEKWWHKVICCVLLLLTALMIYNKSYWSIFFGYCTLLFSLPYIIFFYHAWGDGLEEMNSELSKLPVEQQNNLLSGEQYD